MVARCCLVALSALATTAVAQPRAARSIDFQGGLTVTQSVRDQQPLPGILLEVRGYHAPHLWLSGAVAIEPALDLRDPEHGELSLLVGGGVGTGLFINAGDRFTFLAGGRVDAVTANAWPSATHRVYGLRAGPTASAVLVIGHAYGHPMALDARVEWLHHDMNDGASPGRWQAGILISGVFSPVPARSRPDPGARRSGGSLGSSSANIRRPRQNAMMTGD